MRHALLLALVGCGLVTGPHWTGDEHPPASAACSFGELEGSDDCRGAVAALGACAAELAKVGLTAIPPMLIQVDPSFRLVTGGTEAGTANIQRRSIIVLDADWVNNALCHEEIHLTERPPDPGHVGWPAKGYQRAIQQAAEKTWLALHPR